MQMIILSGFGDLNDIEICDIHKEELFKLANNKGVDFYPTYYDWELKGDREKIAEILKEVYGIDDNDDEWQESGFEITYIESEEN